jgi:hypothetical protein
MIDLDPCGAFVATQAGFEHMNEGGRIVGGCRVGERAMVPILEYYGYQRRDQNVRTAIAERSGASTH